jgi:sulfoxide reductase heme-binding subunit YedZ
MCGGQEPALDVSRLRTVLERSQNCFHPLDLALGGCRLHPSAFHPARINSFAHFDFSLHFVAYFWLDQGLNVPGIFADIAKRPYITIGMLALLLLIPLAVTSTNGWIRRLKKRWQTLHRLIYPIAILGVWHFWWQVKKDIREPLIYAAILAVLLGWRLWRGPVRRRLLTSKSAPATAPGRT